MYYLHIKIPCNIQFNAVFYLSTSKQTMGTPCFQLFLFVTVIVAVKMPIRKHPPADARSYRTLSFIFAQSVHLCCKRAKPCCYDLAFKTRPGIWHSVIVMKIVLKMCHSTWLWRPAEMCWIKIKNRFTLSELVYVCLFQMQMLATHFTKINHMIGIQLNVCRPNVPRPLSSRPKQPLLLTMIFGVQKMWNRAMAMGGCSKRRRYNEFEGLIAARTTSVSNEPGFRWEAQWL